MGANPRTCPRLGLPRLPPNVDDPPPIRPLILSPVEGDSTSDSTSEEFVPDPGWVETLHEIKRMEDEGILTPDPNAPKIDMSIYMKGTDEEIKPYAAEAAAKLRDELDLQIERQKQWPGDRRTQAQEARSDLPVTLRRRPPGHIR